MVDRSDTLLQEAEEELKKERWQQFFEKNGTYLLAAAVAVVLAVAGWQYQQKRQIQKVEATGDALLAALREAGTAGTDAKKLETARSQLEGLSKEAGGPALLARLRLAILDAEAGKIDEAVKTFDAIGAGPGDPTLTQYAKLRAALLRVDAADWTEMQNRLTSVAADTSPWRHQAREILGLAAIKAGQTAEASKVLESILGDRATPQGIGERARLLLSIVTEAEARKAAEAKAAPAAKAPEGKAVETKAPEPKVAPAPEKAPPQKGTK